MSALNIAFPPDLPVTAHRETIMAAMRAHQVVVVCGETGSGKTTQLPKIALALGRGRCNSGDPRKGQLIGHTQPRRIAASSVAKRIAQELQSPLGEVVGFKVRFQDRLSPSASVKLMTDGILLAETQTDPLLQAYDTIIIDEAHERSLNIDFLLGHLRQILPRRPDLKVVVTSATIDAERFAAHFASANGPAPVITVSGRTYPVEQRWRPFEETREHDLNSAIADAVDELWRDANQGGDILVFLPGEREIREAADTLRGHFSHSVHFRQTQVLPLFARLSQAEQERIFEPHSGLRVVLATNVAETSLTVPGIRFVIDAGLARVKRYSFRSKVEQLLVEPISQASANQRAGRCGRVANGICIRLYDEAQFQARPRFTDPEILRSSLAGVILRMKSLGLGGVEDFPFLERPSTRAIADGYQLLQELGAVDEDLQLTRIGHELSRLPLDPRVGRMILEARNREAMDEILVIASALSLQDVRDRPVEAAQLADTAHRKFDDEKSEFAGYLKLWRWLDSSRGGHGVAWGHTSANATHKLSNRQYEQLLRQNFVSARRVREWRDVHSQLLTVVKEHQWRLNTKPASYEQIHISVMAGLMGNVGCKLESATAGGEYLGARGIKFFPHPGAHLSKKPARWLVAAELVETARLFGRGLAAIEPAWIEQVGAHLLKKQILDPHWEKKAAQVFALERATLYGIVVYSARRVAYSRFDLSGAREIFIRQALVAGQWDTELTFLAANLRLVAQIEELEHKSRRQDVLVDEELIYAFYDKHLPPEVCSGQSFEDWYRQACRQSPNLLKLQREELMRHEAAGITTAAYPKTLRLGGVDCAVQYLHQPGDTRDGLNVTVPLFALNQIDEQRCEWLVPGMLKDKIQALLKTLQQRARSRLLPLAETAAQMATTLTEEGVFGQGDLLDRLTILVRQATSIDVVRNDFKTDTLAAHFFMHFRVMDEHGRQLGSGRNLGALKAQWGSKARGAFQALAQLKLSGTMAAPQALAQQGQAKSQAHRLEKPEVVAERAAAPASTQAEQRYTDWSFGELPELLEVRKSGQSLIGYPALVDGGDAVTIEVFDELDFAQPVHRRGLRRLFALQLRDALKYLEKNIPNMQTMAVAYSQVSRATSSASKDPDDLRQQILELAVDRAFLNEPLPMNDNTFRQRLVEGRARLGLIGNEVARLAAQILADYSQVNRKLKDLRNAAPLASDVTQQLERLMPPRFLIDVAWTCLQHYPRYLKAICARLDKYRSDPARDAAKLNEIRPLEQRFWRQVADRKGVLDERLQTFRWLLEELRVSFFAQELRTPQPVSVKRLEKAWAQLG